MANLLQVSSVSKAYSRQVLLNEASFSVGERKKIAVIGRNGAGKSTLFNIITGHEQADSGEVIIGSQTQLGYLKQEDDFLDRLTEKVCDNVFAVRRNQKDTTTIGNKTEFANLDLAIQKRLIPYWLTKEKVIFSPSNTHIMEIIRFLKSPRGGTHSIHQTWCIKKQQNNFWIEKL